MRKSVLQDTMIYQTNTKDTLAVFSNGKEEASISDPSNDPEKGNDMQAMCSYECKSPKSDRDALATSKCEGKSLLCLHMEVYRYYQ